MADREMTNEEAIEILEDIRACYNVFNGYEAFKYAALSKAIFALNAEPMEFEWCHDCKEYDQNAHCCHRWTKVIRNTVNDLKTQGYELVKRGEWIREPNCWYRCSVCGEHYPSISDDMKYNYCPNCGSKMDEVEE